MVPRFLVIHHSAGPRGQSTADITAFHTRPEDEGGRGWEAIGYHKIIEEDGSIHQGRPDTEIGAHAIGYNAKSLGICVTGDYNEYPLDSDHPQWITLVQACAVLCIRYALKASDIIYHRETYRRRKVPVEKNCPGKLFPAEKILRDSVSGYLKGQDKCKKL